MNKLMFALIAALAVPAHAAEAAGSRIEVVGTAFHITTGDGRVVQGVDVAGAVMSLGVGGAVVRARIDSITPDPDDPSGEILLHDVRVIGDDGSERPLCNPTATGSTAGFPLAGRTDAAGNLLPAASWPFEFVCISAAQGKCVRFGYVPWRTGPDGQPLLDHYNACVHMVRADYCGNGFGYTRDGTRIGFGDRIGIEDVETGEPEWDELRFEAAWGPQGALCVARTRLDDVLTLDGLSEICPRLAGKIGPEHCGTDEPGALLINYSH
jgi:hypothetical protein